MRTVYRSKIDWWLMALLFLPFGWALVESALTKDFEDAIILIIISLVIMVLLLQIKYVIFNGNLEVKTGLLGTQRIDIKEIHSISKTFNPLSAPALSINRLEIKYGNNYDYVLISPRYRDKFITELKTLNPDIQINL